MQTSIKFNSFENNSTTKLIEELEVDDVFSFEKNGILKNIVRAKYKDSITYKSLYHDCLLSVCFTDKRKVYVTK